MKNLTIKAFTANGNFTVPAGITEVILFGRGGSGGGGGGHNDGGGWGGGGACSVFKRVSVTPGSVIAVTIGAAGTAGAVNTDGGNGGDTTFGALATFKGAKGGSTGVIGLSGTTYTPSQFTAIWTARQKGVGVGGGGNGGAGECAGLNAEEGKSSSFAAGGTVTDFTGVNRTGGGGGGGDGVGGISVEIANATDGTDGGGGGGGKGGGTLFSGGAGTAGRLLVLY